MTILLAASLLPPLYLLWKVYQSDTIEKEPPGLLLNIFLLGMLATIPAGILEMVGQYVLAFVQDVSFSNAPHAAGTRIYNLLFYFLVVGVAEEVVKYFAMRIPTWRNPEFNYVFDGVVYGVTASLGFAALENVLYVLDSGLITAGVRAWTSIPLHCITGIFMGHYYGIARVADLWRDYAARSRMQAMSILVPVLIHGAYDFIATDESPVLTGFFFVYIIAVDIIAIRALRRYSGNDVRIY